MVLIALVVAPMLIAVLGTVAAVGWSRPISITCVLWAVVGLGLVVLIGNAGVGDRFSGGP